MMLFHRMAGRIDEWDRDLARNREWYERVYPSLSGHGLWLCGDEPGRMDPEGFAAARCRILFSRLSTWADTIESISHRMLYQIAREVDGLFADYAFLPPRADIPLFEASSIPWMLGIHTKRGARSFDIVGFSNSIVQELVNIVPMLEKSGIPVRREARMAQQGCPLVILGGANAVNTSLLHGPDSPVDLIFAGESPAQVRELFALLATGVAGGESKGELVERVAREVAGCILPGAPAPTRKVHSPKPGGASKMVGAPVPLHPGVIGSGVVQISEGCRSFCSFCSESWVRKPYREERAADLADCARMMKRAAGLHSLDLFSFNFASHSEFYEIVAALAPAFATIGLKSQRIDSIAADPELLPMLHALGKTKLTFGIEGVSERLRRYLSKDLSEAQIVAAFNRMAREPIREIKLFYVLTGLETTEDLEEMTKLVVRLRKIMQNGGRTPRMVLSATPLVRFPCTPLEWEQAPTQAEVAKLSEKFVKAASRADCEARMAAEPQEYWFSQIAVRARDSRLLGAIEAARRKTDFLFHACITARFAAALREELAAAGLDEAALLAPANPGDDVPWALVDGGVKRSLLAHRAEKARSFAAPEPHAHPFRGPIRAHQQILDMLAKRRASARTLTLRVELPLRMAGKPRSLAAALLASALMNQRPDLTDHYMGFEGGIWEGWDCPTATGADLFRMSFAAEGAGIVEEILADETALRSVNVRLAGWMELRGLGGDARQRQLRIVSPYAFNGQAWMSERHIRFTLRKAEGWSIYDMPPQVLRKSPVKALRTRALAEGGCEVCLDATDAFDLREFLRIAFVLPGPEEWVRLRVGLKLP
jgi:radical SAM superfamily enzyme YgiQ (UPF0313 family)